MVDELEKKRQEEEEERSRKRREEVEKDNDPTNPFGTMGVVMDLLDIPTHGLDRF